MTTAETNNKNTAGQTIGQRLRAAREAKGLTPADVCKATNMMEKHVLSLEEDDFSSMGAAIYTKGFIKMYAEFLGLNTQELVGEYTRRYLRKKPTPNAPHSVASSRPKTSRQPRKQTGQDLKKKSGEAFRKARNLTHNIPKEKLRFWGINVGMGISLLLVIAFLIFGIKSCIGMVSEKQAGSQRSERSAEAVIEEPPAPYVND